MGRGADVKRALRWLLWLSLAFLIYSIFRSPEQAAAIVVGGFEGIGAAFEAIFRFFDAILAESTNP